MDFSGRRIAKNTLFLYGRMLLLMVVSLYTSRVVLNALGIVDFGVFNVVGGVVAFVGFLNSSLITSTQRFLNVEMSIGNAKTLNETFCQAINAHVIIGLGCFLVLQTAGFWFVVNKLVFSENQLIDAIWVYECSIAVLFISIISAPYNAVIIANEKMSVFAALSILDASLRLGTAFAITAIDCHRLRLYAILLLSVSFVMRFVYSGVCLYLFRECKYHLIWKGDVIKKMFAFSGWMIFGTFSDVLAGQGVNMLINIFFGPALNAARAVAVQVQSAVSQFSSNFMMSVNPQIVKLYSGKEVNAAYQLVFQSSKLSFILMLMIVVPVSVKAQAILSLWLKEVPEYAAVFVQIILLEYLIRSSYTPIAQINVASGRIKAYQLSISILFMLVFVGTYFLFKMGYPVYTTFILSVVIAFIGLFVRLRVLSSQNRFPMAYYLKNISLPLLLVLFLSYGCSYGVGMLFSARFLGVLTSCLISFVFCLVFSWCIALSRNERKEVSIKIQTIIDKI